VKAHNPFHKKNNFFILVVKTHKNRAVQNFFAEKLNIDLIFSRLIQHFRLTLQKYLMSKDKKTTRLLIRRNPFLHQTVCL